MTAFPRWIQIVNEELDRLHAEMPEDQEYPTLEQLREFDKRVQERMHND